MSKHGIALYKKPSEELLLKYGISKKHKLTRAKVLFVSSFDLNKMSQFKNANEIASFFETDSKIIRAVKKMQKFDMTPEEVFPKEFPNFEDRIEPNGDFQRLKKTSLYKRLAS